jgi:hypothetical protein
MNREKNIYIRIQKRIYISEYRKEYIYLCSDKNIFVCVPTRIYLYVFRQEYICLCSDKNYILVGTQTNIFLSEHRQIYSCRNTDKYFLCTVDYCLYVRVFSCSHGIVCSYIAFNYSFGIFNFVLQTKERSVTLKNIDSLY